uniref:Uncharacterized protein n=1 Tax=uncultured marine crenarchaeote HF4000_ANIW141O9 TaxID=455581 RepID=B3T680_9ARCH|nr:hypothetical protein ALOHA_HF4000ANIW141O9ctg1g33 [uncultured marine crenarchaeote HF4000_ANIW141O9]
MIPISDLYCCFDMAYYGIMLLMRDSMKHHSGTSSGTRFLLLKFAQNRHFFCGGKNPRFLKK